MASWQDFAASYGDSPLGKLSGVHNSKLYDQMARQIAGAIGFDGPTSTPGTYQFENANEGGTYMDTAQGSAASPEFLKALEAYQFQRTSPTQGAISREGQNVGTFTAGNKDTGFDKFANVAIPIALSAMAGNLAGGLLGGAPGVAGASGLGAAGDVGFLAANGMTDAAIASSFPQLATAGGLSGVGGAAGALAAAPISAAEQIANLSANGMTDAAITSSMPELASSGGLTGVGGNLTSGGLLGSLGQAASTAGQWMKDNPTLGRLVMGGATSLLSGSGGGGGASEAAAGPPVKWNSPLQQGLLSPVQQYAPAAITQNRPAGLLAQGYANDGAWRYLGG